MALVVTSHLSFPNETLYIVYQKEAPNKAMYLIYLELKP